MPARFCSRPRRLYARRIENRLFGDARGCSREDYAGRFEANTPLRALRAFVVNPSSRAHDPPHAFGVFRPRLAKSAAASFSTSLPTRLTHALLILVMSGSSALCSRASFWPTGLL